MSITAEIERYLKDQSVDYEVIEHPAAYTAPQEAAASHVSGYEWAKTVILFTETGETIMATLPASFKVDIGRLQKLVDAGDLRLAEESEFAGLYPNCEPGAMPPLGALYGQRVFVDERLAEDEMIVFNAGTHTDAVRISYGDFERLVQPEVGAFGRSPASLN